MKLVPNASSAWKWFSTQALTILTAMPLVWITLPPDMQEWLPETWRPWVLSAVALGGLAGRMIDQGTVK